MNCLKIAALASILFTLVAAPVGAHTARASATQASAAEEPPAIVIGFVGGFVRADDSVHSEVQLAERLRRAYPSAVDAEVFENHRWKEAHQRILTLLTANSHGVLSAEDRRDARIVLYGHSWGGTAVIQVARALQADGIPVLLTIQVDAVPKSWQRALIIPSNVAEDANFYQTHGIIRGIQNVRVQDPSRTHVIGNFRLDYTDAPLKCSQYPWWDGLLMKSHTQIECDPAVWNKVNSLVTAALSLPPSSVVESAQIPGASASRLNRAR